MRAEFLLAFLRYDRAMVLGVLIAAIAAAWAFLLLGAGIEMEMMDMGGGQLMRMLPEWTPGYVALIFVMWAVMMAAMMLPSAAPTVLLVAALARSRLANSNLVPATAMLFASGYLLVWCGFSIVATLMQWGLDEAGLLSENMAMANAVLAGAVLIAAGVYQWTPLKTTCLSHCRSPAEFLVRHWHRHTGRGPDWDSPRAVLPRLLLDADGAFVCRRIDEPCLGRCDRVVRAIGKDNAMGRPDEPSHRRASRPLGRSEPRQDDLK